MKQKTKTEDGCGKYIQKGYNLSKCGDISKHKSPKINGQQVYCLRCRLFLNGKEAGKQEVLDVIKRFREANNIIEAKSDDVEIVLKLITNEIELKEVQKK